MTNMYTIANRSTKASRWQSTAGPNPPSRTPTPIFTSTFPVCPSDTRCSLQNIFPSENPLKAGPALIINAPRLIPAGSVPGPCRVLPGFAGSAPGPDLLQPGPNLLQIQ